MDLTRKKRLVWILTALLLLVILSAVKNGTSNLFSIYANRSVESWKLENVQPTDSQTDSVFRLYRIAHFLNATDPTLYENLARVNLVQASLPGISEDKRRTYLLAGLAEIHSALRLRPISPYSWTILLSLKRELGEFDAEFRFALHRAVELGPWEPDLLVSLADIGLSAWSSLPAEEQAMIQQVFVRGMERQSLILRELAELHSKACSERGRPCY